MTSTTGVLIVSTDVTQITWLWRWLPLRLSKRQSMSSQTVLLRTTLTRTIVLYLIITYLIGVFKSLFASDSTNDSALSAILSRHSVPWCLNNSERFCFWPWLYGLGYPRQPLPRRYPGRDIFPVSCLKVLSTVYMSRARQLGCARDNSLSKFYYCVIKS